MHVDSHIVLALQCLHRNTTVALIVCLHVLLIELSCQFLLEELCIFNRLSWACSKNVSYAKYCSRSNRALTSSPMAPDRLEYRQLSYASSHVLHFYLRVFGSYDQR